MNVNWVISTLKLRQILNLLSAYRAWLIVICAPISNHAVNVPKALMFSFIKMESQVVNLTPQ